MQSTSGPPLPDDQPRQSTGDNVPAAEWQQEREQIYRSLDAAGVAGWMVNLKTGLAFCSDRLKFLFGLPHETPTWAPVTVYVEAVHVDDRPEAYKQLGRSAETGEPFDIEFRVTCADGNERWVLSRGTTTPDESGAPAELSGAIIDITDRRRAEQALRVSERQRRLALESAEIGAWNIDLQSFTLSTDERFRAIFGATVESLGFDEAVEFIHPDDRETVQEAVAAACRPADPQPYAIEYRVVHPNGKIRWVAAKGRTNVFGDGADEKAVSFDGTVRDVTDQKSNLDALRVSEAKLRRLHAELEDLVQQRTEQLEAAVKEAESFNYSIAHDLRSPLRAIVSTSGILLEDAGPELAEEHRIMLRRQSDNAIRLGRLIDELLRMSKFSRAEVNRAPLAVTNLAREVFHDLQQSERTHGCRIEVQHEMSGLGDEALVRTVLHNLIGNACKFSPNGGLIRVDYEAGVYSVSDQGIGFDMKFAPKIFVPFERLVDEQQFPGTGIGLANVERIIKRHGGRVWVDSEPGKGTTFFFTLQ